MRRQQDSVGFNLHLITTQRNQTAPPGVCGWQRAEDPPRPHTCFLSRKNLQTIGVYLTKLFGSNVRFRILKELGSTKAVACVAEIVYPDKFYGTRIGIPRGVLK